MDDVSELCEPTPQQNSLIFFLIKACGNVLKDITAIEETFIQRNLLELGKDFGI